MKVNTNLFKMNLFLNKHDFCFTKSKDYVERLLGKQNKYYFNDFSIKLSDTSCDGYNCNSHECWCSEDNNEWLKILKFNEFNIHDNFVQRLKCYNGYVEITVIYKIYNIYSIKEKRFILIQNNNKNMDKFEDKVDVVICEIVKILEKSYIVNTNIQENEEAYIISPLDKWDSCKNFIIPESLWNKYKDEAG